MPRLEGDLLATQSVKLVDSIDKSNLVSNELLYKRWLPAYDWQWSSGMADFTQIGDAGYAARMGKSSGMIASLRVEEFWVKGVGYFTVYCPPPVPQMPWQARPSAALTLTQMTTSCF